MGLLTVEGWFLSEFGIIVPEWATMIGLIVFILLVFGIYFKWFASPVT